MPVKLSGALIAEARDSAERFHRSLTGQIAHWATIGKAVEARLTTEAQASLLEGLGHSLKITDIAQRGQRDHVVGTLAGFLAQSPDARDQTWLAELNAQGIPLYGTRAGSSEIVRRDPDGTETLVCPGEEAVDH